MKKLMQRAGSAGPSANRITLLRDTDGDGVAEVRETFLSGLRSPFGMALAGTRLYVANTDAIVHHSSASTARGIAARLPATRSSSSRSATADPPACRSKSFPAS